MDNSSLIKQILSDAVDDNSEIRTVKSVAGGCISTAVQVVTERGFYFIKYKKDEPLLFVTERVGLTHLAKYSKLRIPKVYKSGSIESIHFLVTEWIEKNAPSDNFWENFGRQLADLHRNTNAHFGFHQDNFIGRLPQKNSSNSNWIDFFISCRLEPQLKMAVNQGYLNTADADAMRKLYNELENILPLEPPSLLHGDLWSGNFMVDQFGQPCVFDPAVYYGHREMEVAFTHMFGGFDSEFYEAYESEWPLQPGFFERIPIHNLYPTLVHVNLFGHGYVSGVRTVLQKFT